MALKIKRTLRRLLRVFILLFILANIVTNFHAYKFTHFSNTATGRSRNEALGILDKTRLLFLGVDNPRPLNKKTPEMDYETVRIKSNKEIECWYIKVPDAKGSVALFHGYGGEKSGMLEHARFFLSQGFNALLVDFMGAGASEGNQTTIGYKEGRQVKDCYEFLIERKQENIFLFGSSLGAAAILKAADEFSIQPSGIILECPFGSLYKTVGKRFDNMGVPKFPMAGLLVFWGGVQNGFWGFDHNPSRYAKSVKSPALVFYGAKDDRVTRKEIDDIVGNIPGEKRLVVFPEAGHDNYLAGYRTEWETALSAFMEKGVHATNVKH